VDYVSVVSIDIYELRNEKASSIVRGVRLMKQQEVSPTTIPWMERPPYGAASKIVVIANLMSVVVLASLVCFFAAGISARTG
jgi:hypothetical protein